MPWEQTADLWPFGSPETGPDWASPENERIGEGTPSIPDGTHHPPDASFVQDEEANPIVWTRDLRELGS